MAVDTAPLTAAQPPSTALPDADDDKYAKHRPSSTRANALLHTLAWLAAATLLTHYTSLPHTLLNSPHVHRIPLHTGTAALLTGLAALMRLAYALPGSLAGGVGGVDGAGGAVGGGWVWVVLCGGLVWYVCWCVALWAVYGLLAPAMLFVLGMAAVLSVNLLPG